MLSRFRDPFSGLSHTVTAVAAVVGAVALLVASQGDAPKQLSLIIYGLSLVLMFTASAAYHLPKASPATLLNLRKFDHCAIYLLIAGSYTPFCYNLFSGFWQWGMLTVIWALAVMGVIVKLFVISAPRWVTALIYVAMGWLAVFGINEMVRVLPLGGLVWLLAGGLTFTLGAVVYVTKIFNFVPGVFGFHEVWHIFVIVGCLCHFIAVWLCVV
jgi:hemolysin III